MLWKLEEQSRSGNISRVFLRFRIWTVKTTFILRKKVRPSILCVLLPGCASIKSMSIYVLEEHVPLPQKVKDLHKQTAESNRFLSTGLFKKTKPQHVPLSHESFPYLLLQPERTDRESTKKYTTCIARKLRRLELLAAELKLPSLTAPWQWANLPASASYG